MKIHDFAPLALGLRQLLDGALTDADAIHLAEPVATRGEMPHGFHSHDAWELFCPLRETLQFVIAGHPQITIPNRHLLIVPPGCLHMQIDLLPQPPKLNLLVMNLPGNETPCGGLSVGSLNFRLSSPWALSPAELTAWTTCVGTAPGVVMEQAAQALSASPWSRERALGLLRVLVAAYAEVATHPQNDRQSLDARRVAEAEIYLQSHYYEPTLTMTEVAGALRLSAVHLGFLFRKTTGRTLHQALIDLRLRRATDLLTRSAFSIKEIAALTGWSNQLYFSAAYRRRYGKPPSAVRSATSPQLS